MSRIAGHLEIGLNEDLEVVINHPDLRPDADGNGHIILSAEQARNLAGLILKHAEESDKRKLKKIQ